MTDVPLWDIAHELLTAVLGMFQHRDTDTQPGMLIAHIRIRWCKELLGKQHYGKTLWCLRATQGERSEVFEDSCLRKL